MSEELNENELENVSGGAGLDTGRNEESQEEGMDGEEVSKGDGGRYKDESGPDRGLDSENPFGGDRR